MRDVLYYYRLFAGWSANAGTLDGALNDFKTLAPERRHAFCEILISAANRGLADVENVDKFLAIGSRK